MTVAVCERPKTSGGLGDPSLATVLLGMKAAGLYNFTLLRSDTAMLRAKPAKKPDSLRAKPAKEPDSTRRMSLTSMVFHLNVSPSGGLQC